MESTGSLKPSRTFTMLACLALAAGPKAAVPATATATFSVSVNVVTTCVISATPLSFGAYQGTSNSDSSSTITVNCSNTAPYDIGLDAGTGLGATVTTRSMTGPVGTLPLNYSLFSDSALTVNWGNTVGTDAVHGTGIGSAQTLTVYGRVPSGQGNRAGAYTDTITATVTY